MPTSRQIALDVDGVLADFHSGLVRAGVGMGVPPQEWDAWEFPPEYGRVWARASQDPYFWANLEPLMAPADIPFEPVGYITHRPIPTDVTLRWLERHGFPRGLVVTTDGPKSVAMRQIGATVLVDDSPANFLEVNGHPDLACFLYDARHNRDFKEFGMRIKSLDEVLGVQAVRS